MCIRYFLAHRGGAFCVKPLWYDSYKRSWPAMVQTVSPGALTEEVRVQSQTSVCGKCVGKSDTGTDFSSGASVFFLSVWLHQFSIFIHSSITDAISYPQLTESLNNTLKSFDVLSNMANLQKIEHMCDNIQIMSVCTRESRQDLLLLLLLLLLT